MEYMEQQAQMQLDGAIADYANKESVLMAELAEALAWYGEQARLARLIHSEGDAGRHALQDDGGKRARAILDRLSALA
jgi:hypothetical protein